MPHLLLRDYWETSYLSGDLLPVDTGFRIPYLPRLPGADVRQRGCLGQCCRVRLDAEAGR
jgi:hypothetical protein